MVVNRAGCAMLSRPMLWRGAYQGQLGPRKHATQHIQFAGQQDNQLPVEGA